MILEAVGAGLLLVGSVLILRACWRMDQPPPKAVARMRKVRPRKTRVQSPAAMDTRAA